MKIVQNDHSWHEKKDFALCQDPMDESFSMWSPLAPYRNKNPWLLMHVNYIQLYFFFPRIESTRNARRDAITQSPMTLIMWFSRTCYSWFVFVFCVMLVRSPVCQAQCILHLSDVNLALLLWRQLTMCSIYNLMHVISCRKTTALQL
jgi:hypothetical protein